MTDHDSRVRELVAHGYAHAPAVRRTMDEAGVTPDAVRGVADLHRIPVTSKDRLVELHHADPPFGGFLAVDPADLPRIYISPGPIFDPQPVNPDGSEAALEMFRYVGFGRGDRVLNTFMYHLVPAGLLLDEALRAVGATVVPTGPGNTELQIMAMQALQTNGFIGQPSYLMSILDKCAEMGIPKEAVPIKKALFSAEPYTPSQRARFEGEYGMKTTSAYATADIGMVAYTVDGLQGFVVCDTLHMQICSPETGEPLPDGEVGEIVVTVFNRAYPLIRFGTGDLGVLSPAADPKANGRQHLLGLFGRSGEAVKVRGMFMHPNQIRMALARFAGVVTGAQAIITRPENRDVVHLNITTADGTGSAELEGQVKGAIEMLTRLRVDSLAFVPELDAGGRVVIDQRTWD